MATRQKLDWKSVELTSLPPNVKKLYDGWKAAIEKANTARDEMQAAMTAHLTSRRKIPSGMGVAYAFYWGKLAIAFAPPDEIAAGRGGSRDTFSF